MKALALRLVVVSGRRRVSRLAPVRVRRALKSRFRASGMRVRRGARRRIGRRAGKGWRPIVVRVVMMENAPHDDLKVRVITARVARVEMMGNAHRAASKAARIVANARRAVSATGLLTVTTANAPRDDLKVRVIAARVARMASAGKVRRVALRAVASAVPVVTTANAVHSAVRVRALAVRRKVARVANVRCDVSAMHLSVPLSVAAAAATVDRAATARRAASMAIAQTVRHALHATIEATVLSERRQDANSATGPRAQVSVPSAPSVASARPAVSTNRCRPRHAVSATIVRHEPTKRVVHHPSPLSHAQSAVLPTMTPIPPRARRVAIMKTRQARCVCRS